MYLECFTTYRESGLAKETGRITATLRDFRGEKMFKSVRIIASASLLLLLAWSAPAFSRQDPHEKNKEQEKPQKQDRPAEQHKQDAKPVRQDHQQAKRQQDRERPNQQSNGRQDARRQQQQDNSKKQEQQLARR